eukprot:scaffold70388_cov18-Tisochrysis_lutea.AAC.3
MAARHVTHPLATTRNYTHTYTHRIVCRPSLPASPALCWRRPWGGLWMRCLRCFLTGLWRRHLWGRPVSRRPWGKPEGAVLAMRCCLASPKRWQLWGRWCLTTCKRWQHLFGVHATSGHPTLHEQPKHGI